MLVDVRTYTVKPGSVSTQLAIYEKYGFPVQVRHIGQPLCYLSAESGELNTLVHMWVYDSAADREKRRAEQAKDPDWKVYLQKNVETGYIIGQRTSLMTPASFCPIKR